MEEDHSQSSITRRRRPALSCTVCRRRKLKCDRSLPCGQCVKSKTPDLCIYSAPKSSQRATGVPTSLSTTSPSDHRDAPCDTSSLAGNGIYVFDSKTRIAKPRGRPDELQELRHRVQTLERALARHDSIHTPESPGYESASELRMSDPISNQVRNLSDIASFRGKNVRTRFRGRSTWEVSFRFLNDVGAFLQGRKKDLKAEGSEFQKMKQFRCEMRAKELKDQDLVDQKRPGSIREMLPPRNTADELLNLYISTFETTYRILHVPSFLKEYEAYWANPEAADLFFIAKLLSAMAAASCFISPTATVNGKDTLHDIAVGWILNVQFWIASLLMTATAKIDALQIHCLLMIARQALAVDGDMVFVTSGSLVHSAMIMGLHRDPSRFSKMSPFWAEIRRRLWAAILELDLQASVDIGVAPSIDPDQYDCDLPSNCDDADLTEDMLDGPVNKDSAVLTQCSFQTMLARSFPLRVRIAKATNSLKFNLPYDEALRLSEELVRHMNEALVPFPTPTSNPGNPSSFARSFMLFLIQRSLLTLHRPYSLSVSLSPKYSYSRKVCLETALELLAQFEPPIPDFQTSRIPSLGHISGGMFRDECSHAAITLCLELSLQITESGSNSAPSAPSGLNDLIRSQQDCLLSVLERTQNTFRSRISPKGNGCKAFVFLSMSVAAVKARLNGEDPLKRIEQAAMRAVKLCQQIMSGSPSGEIQVQVESDPSNFGQSSTHTPDFGSSSSDFSFDPISFLSTNPHEVSPLDFNNIFDSSFYRMPELWDPNFLPV
ncbi:fungal-specific transcription factor domain-containing protein [Aspergillus granulosus]|uniref:Fungal-specific transcription factor domain-containing protein n=1 Tax=Aspergillus granulosus TaxID=176169 RepID=A0ABR4H310_9EURO